MPRPRALLLAAAVAAVAVLAVPEAAAQTCTCPQPPTQANFEADRYLGSWYEMRRVPRDFEEDGECGMAHYEWNSDKTAVNVINTNYVPETAHVGSVNLLATPVDIANGKLSVTFPNIPQIPASQYWVLGTDYNSYAVVYSCSNQPNSAVPHITLWVLSKDPASYTAATDTTVINLIKNAGLDPSILKPVQHHQGCPAASCGECGSAVANLDIAKLKGRWWEVQHSPYSTGSDKQSCSLSEFASTSDGVRFNATTFEMSGSTDKSGSDATMQLTARWASSSKDGAFNVTGSEGKLCVLGTDYDNWAVVSICLPPTSSTTASPLASTPAPGPFPTDVPAVSGGVFVLARKRGLTSAQQMLANKAVTSAGVPAASMQPTPSTPCPAAALVPTGGSAAATPAALLMAVVAAVVLARPAQ